MDQSINPNILRSVPNGARSTWNSTAPNVSSNYRIVGNSRNVSDPSKTARQLSSVAVSTKHDLSEDTVRMFQGQYLQDIFVFQQVKSLGDYAVHSFYKTEDDQLYAIHRSDASCCPGGIPPLTSGRPFSRGNRRWAASSDLLSSSCAEINSFYKALPATEKNLPTTNNPLDDPVGQSIAEKWDENFLSLLDPTLTDPRLRRLTRGQKLAPYSDSQSVDGLSVAKQVRQDPLEELSSRIC